MCKHTDLKDILSLSSILHKETATETIDWDGFIIPSERGTHVEEYMKEMREDERTIH